MCNQTSIQLVALLIPSCKPTKILTTRTKHPKIPTDIQYWRYDFVAPLPSHKIFGCWTYNSTQNHESFQNSIKSDLNWTNPSHLRISHWTKQNKHNNFLWSEIEKKHTYYLHPSRVRSTPQDSSDKERFRLEFPDKKGTNLGVDSYHYLGWSGRSNL